MAIKSLIQDLQPITNRLIGLKRIVDAKETGHHLAFGSWWKALLVEDKQVLRSLIVDRQLLPVAAVVANEIAEVTSFRLSDSDNPLVVIAELLFNEPKYVIEAIDQFPSPNELDYYAVVEYEERF